MKYLFYGALVLLVVPLQIAVFDRVSIGGIRPDLALVFVCLIGLKAGELDAIAVGILLGFSQDLFSGGLYWENVWLKPLLGLMAALASRNLVNLTLRFAFMLLLALSIFSGSVMFLLKSFSGGGMDFLVVARTVIVPQACYDAVLGLLGLALYRAWIESPSPLRFDEP